MNGTSNSSSSGFSFGDATLRRHSKEGNMVVLDDDGLSVVLIPSQPICPYAILLTLPFLHTMSFDSQARVRML